MQSKSVDIILSVHLPQEPVLQYLQGSLNSIISYTPRKLYNLFCVVDRGWEGTWDYIDENYRAQGHVDQLLRNTDQQGYTRTNNIGLEKSTSEFALLLNVDTVVSPGWLEGLIDCAKRTDAGVVGCKLVDERGNINHAGAFGIGYHRGMNEPNINYFEEESVEWVTGACFMISKKLRDNIGNLDEFYPHWGSDREYCKSAREAGFSIWYCGKVTIMHYTEKSNSPELLELFKDKPR